MRDISIDRDTQNVPGSPPIVETIFRKIDQAAVFVPDLTFVGKRLNDRPTPNPNVLIEYGWAVKSLGYGRMVPVMNTAFGEPTPESMPFDLRHLRNPITYRCSSDLDQEARTKVRDQLAKDLESAIKLVFESREFKDSLPKPIPPKPFQARQPADGRGRFKPNDEAIGIASAAYSGPRKIVLSPSPAIWFPYATFPEKPGIARAVVFAFTNGELWSVDTWWLEATSEGGRRAVPFDIEQAFRETLIEYGKFFERELGVAPPYQWIAGMEDMKDRDLYLPTQPGRAILYAHPRGKCLNEIVTMSGHYNPGEQPGLVLKPFFSALYNACGVSRPDWLDA